MEEAISRLEIVPTDQMGRRTTVSETRRTAAMALTIRDMETRFTDQTARLRNALEIQRSSTRQAANNRAAKKLGTRLFATDRYIKHAKNSLQCGDGSFLDRLLIDSNQMAPQWSIAATTERTTQLLRSVCSEQCVAGNDVRG